MKHHLFTIFDEKAEVFLPPFFSPTIGIATRAFADTINSHDHQFSKHPSDYTLFQLGFFDDHDAHMESGVKKSLGNGVEFLNPKHVSSYEEFENASDPPIFPDQES